MTTMMMIMTMTNDDDDDDDDDNNNNNSTENLRLMDCKFCHSYKILTMKNVHFKSLILYSKKYMEVTVQSYGDNKH
jgi:hypothetical protein